MATLVKLAPSHLLTHPKNMRRFYPEADVREMADSIRAHKGVIEPLIVVASEKKTFWYVVVGNLRLAGGRLLGEDCPKLECKIVQQDRVEQLLTMSTENFVRHDVDAVSEALHYRRLMAEGLTVRDISKRTGIYEMRIRSRLRIIDLDEPIQKYIAEGKLPHGVPVCDALLSIPDKKLRIQLAARLAANPNATTATITSACTRLLQSLDHKSKMKTPSLELAKVVRRSGSVAAHDLRSAASRTCKACNLRESLADAKEPAWSMLVHAAEGVCDSCSLITVQDVCRECPAVELLRALVPNGKVEIK